MHLTLLFCFAGVIGNTRPLNYSVSHSYVLSVVAHDCGGKESRPLLITVEVKHACNTGWSGKLRLRPKGVQIGLPTVRKGQCGAKFKLTYFLSCLEQLSQDPEPYLSIFRRGPTLESGLR